MSDLKYPSALIKMTHDSCVFFFFFTERHFGAATMTFSKKGGKECAVSKIDILADERKQPVQ